MVKVPTYESREQLDPTPVNPKIAATFGNEIVDLSQGLSGLVDKVQKLDDRRQTLKAETYVAKQHLQIQQMAATDPNLDTLNERVDQRSQDAVNQAADLIQSPEARQNFIANANLDIERRNAPVYRTILSRKSQDFKGELTQANDTDIQEYQTLSDPAERNLIKQKIMDRTNQAISDGHVNAQWARAHVQTLLKSADLNQVKGDISISASHAYEEIQKGKEGLYPYLSNSQRKFFGDMAQQMIKKEGSDNKMIYSIAQNHAENQILDKMANNSLTQQDIDNAQLMGNKGIRIRPEFAKAATEAMQDPFPTESVPEKYNSLVNEIQSGDVDPMKIKLDVLGARGITPSEKAHLINAHLHEDPEEGKQSINDMIASGIKQNKQALMQAQKKLTTELADRQTLFRRVTSIFRDHAKDAENLANLQQDYMSKLQTVKSNDERLSLAQEIVNKDTLRRNPGIATADEKGTVFIDKTTGAKRRYYPNGFWTPVKDNQDEQ